ncbi:MAG: MotA/TolQ/ExbB proton channel family protein [Fusobacterium gastrosuis]|uniref:MotA/TolQ/ExbB proton channel family protein n=1 Tax=Fusobacterium gastrosuis TaxID=1755100 RepID=UPI002A9DBCE5|nr:MotA/TolQ/ExbB proton channel family protein [Fusobacteriaceae bacterium]MDY5794371.1 MotA/TolQ/ExbB proton channel family protein [Fusobacterium gastrosuis]
MLHYLEVGGPILWLLSIISVLTLSIILERIVFFTKNEKDLGKNFKIEINKLIRENKINDAISLCKTKKSCIASSIEKFLISSKKGLEVQDYENIIKEVTIEEIAPFESKLNCLASVIGIAPMLGLLGTVTGMIKAFTNISKFGSGDATVVADGIAEALLTTALGLIIAIPAIVAYNYLNRRLEKIESEIDKITTTIINIFRR